MTYQLLIDCYTAHERRFSCFLVPFFSFVIFSLCETYFSLYLNFLLTMSSNQSENETNKYADKNRLRGCRYFLWVFVSKVKLLRETSVISSYINSLIMSIEYLYKFRLGYLLRVLFRTATVIFSAGPCFIRSI